MVAEKVCPKCRVSKRLSDFSRRQCTPTGYAYLCKQCMSEYNQTYRQKNLLRARKNANSWRHKNPGRIFHNYLSSRYGITKAQYEKLLVSQQGRCAICGKKEKSRKRLSVDHDHATDQVRGLLCIRCNLILGHAKDEPSLLRKAASYLERKEF